MVVGVVGDGGNSHYDIVPLHHTPLFLDLNWSTYHEPLSLSKWSLARLLDVDDIIAKLLF